MLSHISIEQFVDRLYPPVHGRRSLYARGIVQRLENAGVTNLGILVKTPPETLLIIKRIGPVFIAQANARLANIGCHIGMTDADIKDAILSKI